MYVSTFIFTVSPALLLSRFIDPRVYRRLRIYGLLHTQPTVKYCDFTELKHRHDIVFPFLKLDKCWKYLWCQVILKIILVTILSLWLMWQIWVHFQMKNPNITVYGREYIRIKSILGLAGRSLYLSFSVSSAKNIVPLLVFESTRKIFWDV